MRFSWKAVALAPFAVPLAVAVAGSAMVAAEGHGSVPGAFLFFLAIGCLVSYGATACMLLPALAVASRFAALTALRAALLGALLGVAVYMPLAWIMWRASGDDSGPPSDTFVEHTLRDLADPWGLAFALAMPLAGLVTAALYWRIAGGRPRGDGTPD
jgi:hypothetical protein